MKRCSWEKLLCKMDVTENVVFTETVIPCAAGTIAELQIRELRVRAAADLTFMAIALLPGLFLLLPDGGFEVNGLMGMLMPGPSPPIGDFVRNIRPEEDEEV